MASSQPGTGTQGARQDNTCRAQPQIRPLDAEPRAGSLHLQLQCERLLRQLIEPHNTARQREVGARPLALPRKVIEARAFAQRTLAGELEFANPARQTPADLALGGRRRNARIESDGP